MVQVAVWLQEAGVDAISISANPAISVPYHEHDLVAQKIPAYGPGTFVGFAEAIKKVVTVPVIVASKISPELGEKVLRQKKADFIAMGRPLVADPELPNKLMSGKRDEIAPCVYCNCCIDPFSRDCTVNAARGREYEYAIKPIGRAKKVVVIGGGPAGMEAARVATLRGHQVTLYEKERKLGGQLILAGIIRNEYEDLNRYLATQMKKLGVKVNLHTQATPTLIESVRPDAVIVASGPSPVVQEIRGMDSDKVFTTIFGQRASRRTLSRMFKLVHWRRLLWEFGLSSLRTPWGYTAVNRLLRFMTPFGKKVAVIGTGLPALEMANFLMERNKEVAVLGQGDSMVQGHRPMYLFMSYYLHRLESSGVTLLTGVVYEEINDKGIVIRDKNGNRHTFDADTIVLAFGGKNNDSLGNQLKGKVAEVCVVGDSADPCGIREAIADGSRIGRTI